MKINFILPGVGKSGGVMVALNYAAYLKKNGHDVLCYYPISGGYSGWKKILFPKLVLRWCIYNELRGNWYKEKSILKHPLFINNSTVRKADVTIATSWITSYWVSKLNQNKGKKVYFIQDFETWGNKKENEIVLRSYKLPFDERITVSTALHDRLIDEINVDSKIVCNGVENCFLDDREKKFEKIIIGMPYRPVRGDDVKNCALGIEVLLKIKEVYPKVGIRVFGFKKPENWNDVIDFVENPSREQLVDFYNKTTIFYVPSIYEGWGLPAMEAMAQKNCVVASNSGLIKEIGVDGVNCIILRNPKDFNETVNLISNLINNIEIAKEIGINARNSVSEMSISCSSKKFEKIIKSV